jgi:hypothetical protein
MCSSLSKQDGVKLPVRSHKIAKKVCVETDREFRGRVEDEHRVRDCREDTVR